MAFNQSNLKEMVPKWTLRPNLTLVELPDSDSTITPTQIKMYLLQITPTADRTLTLPTASLFVSAFPRIRPSQGAEFVVQHLGSTGIVILAMGTNGTMDGSPETSPGNTHRFFIRVDVGAPAGSETYTCYSLQGLANSSPAYTSACGQMELANPQQTYVNAQNATFGEAVTWSTLVGTGSGAMIPLGGASSPSVLNNMTITSTGVNVQSLTVYGLYPSITGTYRYDISAVVYIADWPDQPDDVGHQPRLMICRSGVPIDGPAGTQANNTRFANTFTLPYSSTYTGVPLQGPYVLNVGGLVLVTNTTDYYAPWLQDFTSTGISPSDMRVYNFSLSMNRVGPVI